MDIALNVTIIIMYTGLQTWLGPFIPRYSRWGNNNLW